MKSSLCQAWLRGYQRLRVQSADEFLAERMQILRRGYSDRDVIWAICIPDTDDKHEAEAYMQAIGPQVRKAVIDLCVSKLSALERAKRELL